MSLCLLKSGVLPHGAVLLLLIRINSIVMKLSALPLLAATGVLAGTWNNVARAIPLVQDGKPTAKIYLAPKSSPTLSTAASELNYHLEKMSGAKLEIVEIEDAAQIKAPAIVLGELAEKLGAKPEKKQRIEGRFSASHEKQFIAYRRAKRRRGFVRRGCSVGAARLRMGDAGRNRRSHSAKENG